MKSTKKKEYTSDITAFLQDLLEAHPEYVKDKAEGRALWWDRIQTVDLKNMPSHAINRRAYCYYDTASEKANSNR